MTTAADIATAANAQLGKLQTIESQLETKVNAIKNAAGPSGLTAAQYRQMSDLRAQQGAINTAMENLSYVTVSELDNSDDIKRLAKALTGVVKDLKARTASITAIGADAKSFSAICDAIGGIVPQLKALAG